MIDEIRRSVAPSVNLYTHLVDNQYGKVEDLEGKNGFSQEELDTAYRLGYISSGIDGKETPRYRVTEKGLRHAKISIALDGLVKSMEKVVKS